MRPCTTSGSSNAAAVQQMLEDALRIDDDGEVNRGEGTTYHSSETLEPEEFIQPDSMLVKPDQSTPESDSLLIPYENFTGAILGSSFRFLGLDRSENHGDVYLLERLSPSDNKYEAKAYILHGIPQKLYKYRIRNLKRLAGNCSFVCSVNQQGRKFVVNRRPKTVPAYPTPPSQLGAMGRRGTPEFQKAFPKLPKPGRPADCSFCVSFDLVPSKESLANHLEARIQTSEPTSRTKTDSLVDSIEQHLQTKEVQSLLPPGGSELLKTALRATFASIAIDFSLVQNSEATKPKVERTWRQMESRRIRQWRSRVKKRAEKRLEKGVEDGNQ
ncbi:hypothetical protein EPUS_04698 [Endocarpon pusillum Z07020]|uniref:Uncharacterized protein n=1 Tax=Endocarpon pusillum (strain Z07020 / HMAS-L-300199) TaxID=1263415 RepID=U1HJK4_ENDPU|nr:uncharacterized protein EPUS_04698 [Endocarpon pusillum Z07020]ERF70420.1 hypothetical protein EPUS_04698 [Endocarpon pusillum Z07020]